jgi:hypothetical protein
MALFGRSRDISLFNHINDELIKDIVELELLVYKYDSEYSLLNTYSESLEKFYNEPVILNHLVVRTPQTNIQSVYGSDNVRTNEFRFYKKHLIDANIYLDKGDIICWQHEYYEVKEIEENQLFMGKSENTHIQQHMTDFGYSVSILARTVLIRPEKLNIIDVRA